MFKILGIYPHDPAVNYEKILLSQTFSEEEYFHLNINVLPTTVSPKFAHLSWNKIILGASIFSSMSHSSVLVSGGVY